MKTRHILVASAAALLLAPVVVSLGAVFLISIAVLLIPTVPILAVGLLVFLVVAAARNRQLPDGDMHTPASSTPAYGHA
jgi:hypothetical protein